MALKDLSMPSVEDVQRLQALGRTLGYPGKGGMVCAWTQPGQIILLQSLEKTIQPCFASAAQCSGEPTRLTTCWHALDLHSERWIRPQGCLLS